MRRRRPPRVESGAGALLTVLALSAVVIVVSALVPQLTGDHFVDGGLDVLFGLFICSHPAANAIDLVFHPNERLASLSPAASRRYGLNLLVLAVGCLFLFAGTGRLVGSSGALLRQAPRCARKDPKARVSRRPMRRRWSTPAAPSS